MSENQEPDAITKLAQETLGENDQYPKEVVKYRPAEQENERCADCEYFQGEGPTSECEKVEGEIKAGYTCNLFELSDEEAEAEGAQSEGDMSEEGEQ